MQEEAVKIDSGYHELGLRIGSQGGGKLDERGSQLVDSHDFAIINPFLLYRLQEISQDVHFFNSVLGILSIGAMLGNKGCNFIEELGQLEGVDPFLEETGVLDPKFSL